MNCLLALNFCKLQLTYLWQMYSKRQWRQMFAVFSVLYLKRAVCLPLICLITFKILDLSVYIKD